MSGDSRALGKDQCVELFQKHLMYKDERVEKAFIGASGRELFLSTNNGDFSLRLTPGFLRIGGAEWVRQLLVVTDESIQAAGRPQEEVLVICHDGSVLHVNAEPVAAELGRRLYDDDLDPAAFAEILVKFHPWSSAWCDVITEPDRVRKEWGYPEIPDVAVPRVSRQGTGLRLSFHSSGIYQHGRASARMLKISSWTANIWRDQPARWQSELVVRDIMLDRYQGPE
ncbi:hypothetical protein [Amycolatopsis sp. NPDC051071]|uniref:hypothetical protein n=1 Tax=Amycolatopsis sp. NPDC051071 TaxID=3154637 RepID=UPI00343CFB3F